MIELMRTSDPVLISALTAALAAERIPVVAFDEQVAGLMLGGPTERRLMVDEDDLSAARDVVIALCPEFLPPLPTRIYE